MKYFFKKLFFKIRIDIYLRAGKYEKLFNLCRRLSLFSKKLDCKFFDSVNFDKKLLTASNEFLARCRVDLSEYFQGKIESKQKIAILATTLYDSGGHTECLLRFVDEFKDEYEISLFLTNLYGRSADSAPEKYAYLKERILIKDVLEIRYDLSILELIKAIGEYSPQLIFVYMHMLDSVSASVLGLVKQSSDSKIIYYNHGDHVLSLGMTFSDIILECREVGQYITQKCRGLRKGRIIPFQDKEIDPASILSREEIVKERKKIGFYENEVITFSGFSANKVFRDENLAYFKFIKRLLGEEENFRHLFISNLSGGQIKKIREIFSDQPHLLDRVIFMGFVPDFQKYVQISDIFIDSFPLGSALAHVDVIKHGRPTVIKVNKECSLYSFECYLYDDYEYACDSLSEMFEKTLHLIRNAEEREIIGHKVKSHYLETYEGKKVARQYRDLIENYQHLDKFYQPLPESINLRIK